MPKDYMPTSWTEFAEWLDNFAENLPKLAAKYGFSGGAIAAVTADNDWTQYWVQAKFNAKQQEKQLTDFVSTIADGDTGATAPTAPEWSLPANAPADVPTGIKKRIRQTVAQIKANPVYTEPDGQLLGIIGTGGAAPTSPDDLQPTFDVQPLANYALEVGFNKKGMDALRIEFRHKGGAWELATILTSSPGAFNVAPQTAGQAEQIELRAIFLEKNQPTGNYSDIKPAVIAP